MQITTKKGDLGLTDINGKRIYKSDIVIDCIGEIDTLRLYYYLFLYCRLY